MDFHWIQAIQFPAGYIGPGGGIGLLGPLAGVLLAVAGALFMLLLWPLRLLFRKLKAKRRTACQSAVHQHTAG